MQFHANKGEGRFGFCSLYCYAQPRILLLEAQNPRGIAKSKFESKIWARNCPRANGWPTFGRFSLLGRLGQPGPGQ